jgi:hypothetical protein
MDGWRPRRPVLLSVFAIAVLCFLLLRTTSHNPVSDLSCGWDAVVYDKLDGLNSDFVVLVKTTELDVGLLEEVCWPPRRSIL